MDSIHTYNNTNQTDLTKGLLNIDAQLESEDVKSLKFLCQDHIPFKTLERIDDGIHIFNELERIGKIDTSTGEVDYLLECLCRCHRMDLIKKLGFNQIQVKNRVESGNSNLHPFRVMLFEIGEEMETTDIKTALFTLSSIIPRSKHDKIGSMFDVFVQLERSGELFPLNVTVLYKLLKMMDRGDLVSKVRSYQGDVVTGGNTEEGYGPVDEGQVPRKTEPGYGPVDKGLVPRTIEIAMEPGYSAPEGGSVYQHEAVTNRQPPTIQSFIGNRLPLDANQYQNSATVGQDRRDNSVIDIKGQGQKNGSQSEQIRKRLKLQDNQNDRIVPARTSEEISNISLTSSTEQEHPSYETTGSQESTETFPVPRTGTSGEVPRNHLVHRNDQVTEEQSPGDSGLTAGTISLSDRSSEESSSGEILLSLTETKLMNLSEVIARHENWTQLAAELKIDYEYLSQIMQANPTNESRVHGLLKHWFIRERDKKGSSPNAEGLLKALKNIDFTDAIHEYVRLSQQPEMETEFESENRAVQSEGSMYEQNVSVSTGESTIAQVEDMDVQGPTCPVERVVAHSDVQVGPSLNPLINQSIQRQPNRQDRQEDVVVRQLETVAIDDSAMPYYKMDARPRGIAVIINNMNFHKVRGDNSSKEMPPRAGTEKDAEKLDYIWRKLGYIVRQYNDVDSVRINQLMVEIAFEDHTAYDSFVCCILTHGVLGHVYGSDGRIVRINQLTSRFASRRCTSLAGKPKLFFIQACQGREKQEGHAIETDAGIVSQDSAGTVERQDLSVDRPRELIPDEADFLLGYATVPGYVSYRSRSQGSWYINKLSQNLDKYAYQHDLLSILIKVNEEVGRATANIENGAYKQIPAPMFTLRKRIIFR